MPNQNAEINLSVTFRHTDSTEALKQYSTEKVNQCIQKYIKNPGDAHIVLSVEKRDHIAEVQFHSKGYEVSAKAVSDDLYAAIDKVIDTLDKQLRRKKDKLVGHKTGARAVKSVAP
jgi:putative sigma-54 modulation protein